MRDKLVEARKTKGYTHQQVADIVGIERSHYTNIENGTRDPSFRVAVKILAALEKSFDNIFLSSNVSEGDSYNPKGANKTA